MMTLAGRQRRPSYAEIATPKREGQSPENDNKRNVKVVVRIRPENGTEKSGNFRVVVKAMNEHVLVFDPNEQGSPEYGYRRRHQRRDICKRQNKDLKFAFDYVFHPHSVNHEVYQQTTKKILDSFLEGYNCSVFAYGATGAGKTHTMLGNPDKPGVMYLTMMDLYNRIGDMEGNITCDVAVSYLEVYNEQIRDLLMGGKTLPVREDSQNGVVVPGLSLHKPRDADELLHMLHFGNKNRTQHATDANAESSRSHAVFQVFIRQRDRTANVSAEVKVAKLCLVDLAGSERATVTKNSGKRFREGANINRSLLALGNVINSLADPKYKGHVPYRDSKLTRLLKDSLGGNCQTVMIAAVSPSSMTYEDTYNTLKYADRAKNIQSNLKKNVLNVDFHVARYGQIVEELRKEILELKEKLKFYEEGKLVNTVCQTSSVEVCKLKEKIDGVFCSRLKLCREFLDAELKSRDLEWRIHRKEKCVARMALICDRNISIGEKMKKMVSSSRHRLKSFHSNRDNCVKYLLENKKTVAGMEDSIKSHINSSGDNIETENLKLTLQIHQTSMALTESQYCVKYLTKVVKTQEREIQSTERLITSLLGLVRQQHFIIKGSNLMTSDLETEFKQVQSMTEGREVSFADQTFNAENQSFSLSGLLDFKSLPSMESSAPNKFMLESGYPQTEPDSILHVPTDSDSTYLKSTSSAGHTPFPKEPFGKNLDNSTNKETKVLKSPQQSNTSCLSVPASDVSVITNVLNPGTLAMVSPLDKGKQFAHSQQTNASIDNVRPVSDNSLNSQPFNGTFTVEEDNNEDQNSTFTLMETNDKDPQVLINTPIIPDKFTGRNREIVQHESSNTTCLQNAETHIRQLGNVVYDSVNSPSNQVTLSECVDNFSNTNSAQMSVTYTSQNRTACANPTTNLCDNMMSQRLYSESQLHYQNSATTIQSQTVADSTGMSSFRPECEKNLYVPNNFVSSITQGCVTKSPAIDLTRTFTIQPSSTILQGSSQTVTKEKPDLQQGIVDKSHAVRSITFGGIPCTPESVRKVKSYSEAVQSPPVVRTPLREMNSNTPLSDQTHGKPTMNNKLKMGRENLFGDDSVKVKETSKKLNELGLPSLMERWHTEPRKNRSQVTQPSYMQPTKAVRYRTKSRHVNNENLEPGRVPLNQTVRNRNFKRSQSVSNVTKPGWQI